MSRCSKLPASLESVLETDLEKHTDSVLAANTTAKGKLKCHRCAECNGMGCPGMLPGLGGVYEGRNFQANYRAWKELFAKALADGNEEKLQNQKLKPELLMCGPVTGAQENIGYENEKDFYYPYLKNAAEAGFGLCVGDGCPDEKLKYGVEAVKQLAGGTKDLKGTKNIKAAFFLKPYPQEKLFERIEWVRPYAAFIGIDIDSYNIVTMRNLVHLERKTASQLQEFRKVSGLPFVIKGVFTQDDLALVSEVQPDVVYISNHGGRVETEEGSSGEFLAKNAAELKKHCGQIWVDGGIRTAQDVKTALFYGADKVIAARPLIRGTFDANYKEVAARLLGC